MGNERMTRTGIASGFGRALGFVRASLGIFFSTPLFWLVTWWFVVWGASGGKLASANPQTFGSWERHWIVGMILLAFIDVTSTRISIPWLRSSIRAVGIASAFAATIALSV